MKKFYLFFLLALLPMTALADAVNIDGIYYNLVTKSQIAEVAKNPTGKSGEILIPEIINYEGIEYTVTKICNEAFYGCNITKITIPNSVTSIGQSAFHGCSKLTSAIIGNGVTFIGSEAFRYCSKLNSIDIPNGVTSISTYLFADCLNLTSVSIPNSVTSIGRNAFSNTSITVVNIPSSVISIGQEAFYGCSKLRSLTIPNSVTTINSDAFRNCNSLISIIIPNSITSIGVRIFRGCSNLASITLPNTLTGIGQEAFYGCSKLTSISLPSSLKGIGISAFHKCSSLTSVNIPNNVTKILDSAFSECSNITSITIGSSVTSIGAGAFGNCLGLEDVYCLAENVPTTNSSAFGGSYPKYITLHVPSASVLAYNAVEPWCNFKEVVAIDGDTPETPKCATPEISYSNGEITFSCKTDGVEYISEITITDAKKYYDSKIKLSQKYKVSVYVTKKGYENSEVATKEIEISGSSSLPGDLNGDGAVNVADHVKLSDIILKKVE